MCFFRGRGETRVLDLNFDSFAGRHKRGAIRKSERQFHGRFGSSVGLRTGPAPEQFAASLR